MAAVKQAVGDRMAVIAKINVADGRSRGAQLEVHYQQLLEVYVRSLEIKFFDYKRSLRGGYGPGGGRLSSF